MFASGITVSQKRARNALSAKAKPALAGGSTSRDTPGVVAQLISAALVSPAELEREDQRLWMLAR
jgi:hypothetical protein